MRTINQWDAYKWWNQDIFQCHWLLFGCDKSIAYERDKWLSNQRFIFLFILSEHGILGEGEIRAYLFEIRTNILFSVPFIIWEKNYSWSFEVIPQLHYFKLFKMKKWETKMILNWYVINDKESRMPK